MRPCRRSRIKAEYDSHFSFSSVVSFTLIETSDKVAPNRSSLSYVFLKRVILEICSKFTRENPCRSAILNKVVKQLSLK